MEALRAIETIMTDLGMHVGVRHKALPRTGCIPGNGGRSPDSLVCTSTSLRPMCICIEHCVRHQAARVSKEDLSAMETAKVGRCQCDQQCVAPSCVTCTIARCLPYCRWRLRARFESFNFVRWVDYRPITCDFPCPYLALRMTYLPWHDDPDHGPDAVRAPCVHQDTLETRVHDFAEEIVRLEAALVSAWSFVLPTCRCVAVSGCVSVHCLPEIRLKPGRNGMQQWPRPVVLHWSWYVGQRGLPEQHARVTLFQCAPLAVHQQCTCFTYPLFQSSMTPVTAGAQSSPTASMLVRLRFPFPHLVSRDFSHFDIGGFSLGAAS